MSQEAPARWAPLTAILRRPWVVIGAVGLVTFAFWVKGTRTQEHHVRAGFDTAVNLVPGLDVQIDGIDAGKVSKVEYRDGRAIVELGIDDDRWPLRQGATATIRFGTTVGNGTRRVDVDPGPADAPPVPENGVITGESSVSPVEFDEVFNTLDERSRADLRSMLGNTAESFEGHGEELGAGLEESARGMRAIEALVGDLGEDTYALKGLVVNGHRATRALAAQRGRISDLVSVAATTFDTFAQRSTAMQESLDELPATLSTTRSTLARLDESVDELDPLMEDLGPGTRRLREIAPTARRAIARVSEQAPLAAAAVRPLAAAAPDARALLREATPVTSTLAEVFEELAPMVACVRPYAPEIAAALSNWASWAKNYDGISHFARIKVTASPYSLNATPDLATDEYTNLMPTVTYAMPRPPGLNAGKPWFLPECGAGPESLDPTKDPEDTSPRAGGGATRDAAAEPASGGGAAGAPGDVEELVEPLVDELLGAVSR